LDLSVAGQMERRSGPMELLHIAIQNNSAIDVIERLAALQEKALDREAELQFIDAMIEFKAENFVIPKDKENKQYNSWYTSLEKMVAVVTPFLSRHKLFATWTLDQANGVKVTCTLEGFGHSKACTVTFPPDVSGKKNSLQEIKSAITYGKICTFESVCGLASEAGNLSDDGNSVGRQATPKPTMDAADKKERLEFFPKCSTVKELHDHWFSSYGEAKKIGDKQAMEEFNAAKDARKSSLLKDVQK
jgi:hypothetical protein